MSAFSGKGISLASVIHPNDGKVETWDILTGALPYQEDENGNKLYAWQNATVTPRNEPDGKRQASIIEMAQIARFIDNFNHKGAATTQLKSYLYAGVYLLNKPVSMPVAA